MDVVSAVVRELARYLRQTTPHPGLEGERTGALCSKILESFPSPEEQLAYPTISIHAADAVIRPHEPKHIRVLSEVDAQAKSLWAVANLTVPLQLDVFVNVKSQRRKVLSALRRDLRREILDGITSITTLTLTEYDNEPARYRVAGGGDFGDSGFAASREEWRSVLTVEADVRELVVGTTNQLRQLKVRTGVLLPFELSQNAPLEERVVF